MFFSKSAPFWAIFRKKQKKSTQYRILFVYLQRKLERVLWQELSTFHLTCLRTTEWTSWHASWQPMAKCWLCAVSIKSVPADVSASISCLVCLCRKTWVIVNWLMTTWKRNTVYETISWYQYLSWVHQPSCTIRISLPLDWCNSGCKDYSHNRALVYQVLKNLRNLPFWEWKPQK